MEDTEEGTGRQWEGGSGNGERREHCRGYDGGHRGGDREAVGGRG